MNRRNTYRSLRAAAMAVLATISGCVSRPLPTYPPMDARASIAAMEQRMEHVRTLSGRGELVLDDPSQGSVRLETAFVMQPPDHARVRAWKLGQAVFDLTLAPEGVWLYSPQDPSAPNSTGTPPNEPASPFTESLARTSEALPDWMAVLWGRAVKSDAAEDASRLAPGKPPTSELFGDTIVTTQSLDPARKLRTVIDRSTLTAARADVVGSTGQVVFSLEMSDYDEIDGVVWPREIRAVSSSGRMTILTRGLTVNATPESAFTPPSRARKLP